MIPIAGIISALLLYLFLRGGGKPLVPLAGLVAVALVIVTVRFPLIGLAGLAAINSADVSDNLSQSVGLPSITKILVPGLALIFALRYVLYRSRPFFDPMTAALLLAYLALMFASATYALYWPVTLALCEDYLKHFLVVLLTLAFFSQPGALRVFLSALVVTISLVCLLGFYKYSFGDMQSTYLGFANVMFVEERYAGPLQDPNYFGALLAFLLPIAAGRAVFGPGRGMQAAGLIASLILIAAVILTGSRGAMIAVVVGFAAFLFTLDRRRALTLVALLGVAAVVVGMVFSQQVLTRFALVYEPSVSGFANDISVEGRLASWKVAWQLFSDHPWLGIGAGNFNDYFQNTALNLGLIFRGEGRSPHSLYLEALSELGIVGLGLMLTILIAALMGAVRASRALVAGGRISVAHDAQSFGIGLLSYLVASVFLHDAYPLMLWTIIGTGIALPRIARVETGGPFPGRGPQPVEPPAPST